MSARPPATIWRHGRRFAVEEEVRFGGRPYWVVARLGRAGRSRLKVYDPAARTMRVLHHLAPGAATEQQLQALTRNELAGGCLPQVLDRQRDGDGWRVLTTWTEGESLASYLNAARESRKPWPTPTMAAGLFARFVHGLCQFHQFTSCVHGDISPANLIVQAQPYRLVLIDFGGAWQEERAAQREAGDGVTAGYAAPEMHRGERATRLADQFAATAVFYEMFTGQLPYEGMGGRAGLAEHRSSFAESFIALSRLGRGRLPAAAWEAVDELATRGLRLAPEERFATSAEWRAAADRVRRVLGEENSSSATERLAQWLLGWLKP